MLKQCTPNHPTTKSSAQMMMSVCDINENVDKFGSPVECDIMDLRMLKESERGNIPETVSGLQKTQLLPEFETDTPKTQPRTLKFPPCEICTGKASGLHYGCITCEACKNFFRRYLIRNKRYKCVKDNKCAISSARKGNCSECRLAKCLQFGMSKDKSKMGRYSYSRRTETIQKVKLLEGHDLYVKELNSIDCDIASCDKKPSPALFALRECFSEEEVNLIKRLVAALDEIKPWGEYLDSKEAREICLREHYYNYMSKVKLLGSLDNLTKDQDQTFDKSHQNDLDERLDYFKDCGFHWNRIVGNYCEFTKLIPGFNHLSNSDQQILLKSTHFDFFCLVMHEGYDTDKMVFLEINGKPYHVEEIADKFFSREFIVGIADLYSRLQKENISKEELVLLASMVTLSSDNCELQNSKIVQQMQTFISSMLMTLLKYKLGETTGVRKFTKYVDRLLDIRTLGFMYSKEYSCLCNDEQLTGPFGEDFIPFQT